MKKYLLATTLLMFCACANNTSYVSSNKSAITLNNCPNAVYVDSSLNKTLACDEAPIYDGNGLVANITLTNTKSSDMSLKVAVDWFDANLIHINTQDLGKKDVKILKNDVAYLKFTAPSQNARAYKIRIYKTN